MYRRSTAPIVPTISNREKSHADQTHRWQGRQAAPCFRLSGAFRRRARPSRLFAPGRAWRGGAGRAWRHSAIHHAPCRSGADGSFKACAACEEYLHALFGGLHRDCRSAEWRLGRPGTGLGIADQSRHALRQGRFGARIGAWRSAPEISDEAGEWPMAAHVLGQCDDRNCRQADGNPSEKRTGCHLLAGQRQILQ